MGTEERQQFAKKIMTPLESIAKHLTDHSAIEEAKFEENRNSDTTSSLPLTRYQEINLDDKKEKNDGLGMDDDSEAYVDPYNEDDGVNKEDITVPSNHKVSVDEDYASTEKYEIDAQKLIVTTEKDCANCDNTTTMIDGPKADTNNKGIDLSEDTDTTEGSQPRRFDRELPR